MYESFVRKLLAQAKINVNGSAPADIQVHDPRVYREVFFNKSLALGESYMKGWWDCEKLDEMLTRVLIAKVHKEAGQKLTHKWQHIVSCIANMQSKARASIVAEKHYNLDNDLFFHFLDPYRQYSCAYFAGTDDLEQAQRNKLDLICRKLALTSEDHLLDIGSGWGGLAKFAAEQYGCQVTGINISTAQRESSENFCQGLPIRFEGHDYRDIRQTFSKIASVGMFEHVGWKNYRTYFETAHRCLQDDGIFLLHTIGKNHTTKGKNDPWLDKYIFPNSTIPSISQISKALEGLFVVEDWHNIGPHYDKTLMAWYRNFMKAWPSLQKNYDEQFKRMWTYYLLSCAAAFRARQTQCWQIVLTKESSGRTQPVRQS